MKCLKAGRWQRRIDNLQRQGFGDCDEIGIHVLGEMQEAGLVLSKDFVVVRGTCMV